MAGVKISALPQGTVLADNDLIPYVDVSDNSESATGTTKYMEKSLLAIPTSGTWTPVITGETNGATVTAAVGLYTNVNGVISGVLKVVIELNDLVFPNTDFLVSLPILPTTNFVNAENLIASSSPIKFTTTSQVQSYANVGAKTMKVSYTDISAGQANVLSICFSYQV